MKRILNKKLSWEQTMKLFLASIFLSFFFAVGLVVLTLMLLL